jgi:hypothetical protein
MTKSEAYCHREFRGVALVCLLCCLVAGCAPRQETPPGRVRADFDVAVARDGRTIVWWLRMSGPAFTAMVHQSAANPKLGSVDDLTHRKVETLIVAGLLEHGLAPCDPAYRTIAVMRDGAVQWTGTCTLPSDIAVSRNGT